MDLGFGKAKEDRGAYISIVIAGAFIAAVRIPLFKDGRWKLQKI